MKKTISYIFTFLFVSFVFFPAVFSCQKYSDEEIEGQWKLISATDITTGAPSLPTASPTWNFQLDLLYMRLTQLPTGATTDYCTECMARYRKTPDSLFITSTYWHFRNADSLLTDPATKGLIYLGLDSNKAAYKIEKFTKSEMVLSNTTDRLTFKKW